MNVTDLTHYYPGEFPDHVTLFRDNRTGIAWVHDGRSGNGYSCHDSIHHTGSVTVMKKRDFWGRNDRTVRCQGLIFNIDSFVTRGKWDRLAARFCRCGGRHG